MGPDKIDDEIRRITRYQEWCNLVDHPDSEDDEVISQDRNNEARGTILVPPPLRVPKADLCASKSGSLVLIVLVIFIFIFYLYIYIYLYFPFYGLQFYALVVIKVCI
jgi:hypothetical protein